MLAVDFDPVARGYVASIAKPGGRITGLFLRQIELTEKRLQFFKDAFPAMSAVTVFWDTISADQWEAAQRVGAPLGLQLAGVDLGAPPYDYDHSLAQVPLYIFPRSRPPSRPRRAIPTARDVQFPGVRGSGRPHRLCVAPEYCHQ